MAAESDFSSIRRRDKRAKCPFVLRLAHKKAIIVVAPHIYKGFWLIGGLKYFFSKMEWNDLIVGAVQHQHRIGYSPYIGRSIEIETHENQSG